VLTINVGKDYKNIGFMYLIQMDGSMLYYLQAGNVFNLGNCSGWDIAVIIDKFCGIFQDKHINFAYSTLSGGLNGNQYKLLHILDHGN